MAEESKLAEKLKDSTKFSEEEMKTVKEIQQRYVDVQHKLGQLSVAEIRLNQQLDALNITRTELNDTFINTQKEETDFIKSITEKYGDGVLNPETGEYNKK
jgi:predicted nuclease with TOPRIM domain